MLSNMISQFSMTQWESFGELFSGNTDLIQAISVNVPKINDLNQFILGINISEAPGWKLSWALIIPITAALFQFLSTKTMQTTQPDMGGDQAAAQSAAMMKTMTFTMPIMSLFICVSLPAGIGLYWSISALISLLIQLAINLYYDKFADMDKILEKQMEKAKKKKRKNKKSFMERMMEAAGGAEAANTSSNSVAGANLKNYNNTSSNNDSNSSAAYRKGSIASKANIMQQYNNQKTKE